MDNKKMLDNEELEKVVGGIESANIVGYGGALPENDDEHLHLELKHDKYEITLNDYSRQ